MAELKQIVKAKILMSQILIGYAKRNITQLIRYCSHKCLYCEAGAAASIDSF